MTLQTTGIHHITAFAGDPQANVDFYAGILGLRLVKKTINFDAPDIYHLYFGNESGSPGTAITFFPSPNTPKGKIGGGQVGITTYVMPVGAMGFWEQRLRKFGIDTTRVTRFGEEYLHFLDNEGLVLELVERASGTVNQWVFDEITPDTAIKGFGGAVLYSTNPTSTMSTLQEVLGFAKVEEDGQYARFQSAGDIGNTIDVPLDAMPFGSGGAGTVHHIAWRAQDFEEHKQWRIHVSALGYRPTQVIDRQYFNAIYFREYGGILFEIATDPPGFDRDEPKETMGGRVMLPEWYEKHREVIEANLISITVRELEGK